MKIKAISLWEPWASLMALGPKTIETRGWATRYRGPLLICAAKHWDSHLYSFLGRGDFQRALRPLNSIGGPVIKRFLQFGMALAIVDLHDIRAVEGLAASEIAAERAFGDFSAGRYGWMTRNRRPITPFAVRGQQGVFEVELPDAVAIAAGLKAA